ncbi:unnamed protein product [Urochloa humidicola]
MGDDSVTAVDFKSSMNKLFAELSSVRSEITTIKGDQSRLTVAVNRLQSDKHKAGSSGTAGDDEPSGDGKDKSVLPPPPSNLPPPTHKLRFVRYDGAEDPIGWIHKCEQFFRSHRTPEDEKVPTATYYLDAAAQQWYFRLERNRGMPTWPDFVTAVNRLFGPPTRSNPLGELAHLRRTGSVADYIDQLLLLLARCENVTERQQVDLFTAGLRNPLRMDVEMQKPEFLEDAMGYARSFERRLQLDDDEDPKSPARAPPRAAPPPRSAPTAATTPCNNSSGPRPPLATPSAPGRPVPRPGARFTRLTPQEMAQCRIDGLCFNCPEKFTPGHIDTCTMKGIYLMELDDSAPVDDIASDDELHISLNALTGIKTSDTMHLSTNLAGSTMRALIDSGSTHRSWPPRQRRGSASSSRRARASPWASPTANASRVTAFVRRSPSPSAANASSSTCTCCRWTSTTWCWVASG